MLGGGGLVGHAIARRLLTFAPRRIVLVALYEEEVLKTAKSLEPYRGETAVECEWGNIFYPAPVAKLDRRAILADPAARRMLLEDLVGALTPAVLERSFMNQLFQRWRPEIVVDCINTATAFAYQDIFHSARDLLAAAADGTLTRDLVEQHVLTLTMPQLIRHVQILAEAVRAVQLQAFIKVGTSGTGGMGLNIPYTHSEEKPSRTLLTKSAVAGAHSLLLFLLGRTPWAPATMEIKPTAAIAWREIGFGPIRRKGAPIPLYDCPNPLPLGAAFVPGASGWTDLGGPLESVYVDVGENGVFARDEFETITTMGSMEFITPEEVADYVVLELQGRPTGRDIVTALDSATAGPTYQAGVLRSVAIERLRALEAEHGVRPVAFEMLGPPRLTKNLFEAYVCSRLCQSVRELSVAAPAALAAAAAALFRDDRDLRSLVVSVGLPVVVEGDLVYRGATVIIPPDGDDIEEAIPRGWVDLRAANVGMWVARAQRVVQQDEARRARPAGSGSDEDWFGIRPPDRIEPARFATWIFKYEDEGERIKR
ncbi:MAG: short-chain dehydrogenase, partial [Gemmatimonadota bacterium]|nr:short-chain dehydrogenase [Gemmatimonadota bacterium]